MLDVSNPTRAMEVAYVAALVVGLYLTWVFNREITAALHLGDNEAPARRAHARMVRWQRAAYWCGRHAIAAELRYRSLLEV